VAISLADTAMEYVDFARHCLRIARSLPERKDRIAQREMAAEWISLAQMLTEDAHSTTRRAGKKRIKAVS
jgi:hypothetical protein